MSNLAPFQAPRIPLSDPEAIVQYLETEGYVVVADVLNPVEKDQAITYFWDWLEQVSENVDRNDEKTWINKNWPPFYTNGIMYQYGVHNNKFSWYLRTHPQVLQVFQLLYGVTEKELISALDGAGVFRPPRLKNQETKGGWWHLDHGYPANEIDYKGFRTCVQGMVNLVDANENTGGFCFYPDSHHVHKEILNTQPFKKMAQRSDYVPVFQDEKFIDLLPCQEPKLLCAQAGDMILWDSRLVHCNTGPILKPGKEDFQNQLMRLVAYVCMMPKQILSEEELEKVAEAKLASVENPSNASSHWAIAHQVKKNSRYKHTGGLKYASEFPGTEMCLSLLGL